MNEFDLNFYAGKRVFVTGHTGFKGSWLCRLLVHAGAEVTGYSLNPPTEPSLFRLAGIENSITSVIGDIRDLPKLKAAFDECDPDVVLHLAAQPIVRDSYDDPAYTYETNVMGTVNILECLRRLGVKPEEALYMGDARSDMVAARAAGMDFAYASWGSFFPMERREPDYYLDHPTDLIPFLG